MCKQKKKYRIDFGKHKKQDKPDGIKIASNFKIYEIPSESLP